VSNLEQGVQFLKGVGPAARGVARKLGIRTSAICCFTFRATMTISPTSSRWRTSRPAVLQDGAGESSRSREELPEADASRKSFISDPKGKMRRRHLVHSLMIVARSAMASRSPSSAASRNGYRDHWTMNHPALQVLKRREAKLEVVPVYRSPKDYGPKHLREAIRFALAQAGAEWREFAEPGCASSASTAGRRGALPRSLPRSGATRRSRSASLHLRRISDPAKSPSPSAAARGAIGCKRRARDDAGIERISQSCTRFA